VLRYGKQKQQTLKPSTVRSDGQPKTLVARHVRDSLRVSFAETLRETKTTNAEAFDRAQRWSAKDACCSTCERQLEGLLCRNAP
jgi:hypothetical protein